MEIATDLPDADGRLPTPAGVTLAERPPDAFGRRGVTPAPVAAPADAMGADEPDDLVEAAGLAFVGRREAA